jgi:putative toxin-antitoxin system antitoxin component (TIGR02293 family)
LRWLKSRSESWFGFGKSSPVHSRLDRLPAGCHIARKSRQVATEQRMTRRMSKRPSRTPAASTSAAVVKEISAAHVPLAPAIRATPGALAGLARLGYSDEEISTLVVSQRTLARRRAGAAPLTVEETDKALRLERVGSLAEQVFGDPNKARRWLRTPKDRLGGNTPVAFLASESGARVVEEMLHQIQHGIFA